MFAKINHLAILSERYSLAAKFYEVLFGMTAAGNGRAQRAITVSDGYVGVNINPRNVARPARLDHFGVQVEDTEVVFERMRANHPEIEWLKRPATRPFAGITTHDPDGNLFDLSQKNMANRTGLYAREATPVNPRHISHFGFRTMHADAVADFYRDTLALEEKSRAPGDRNRYLSDGHLTMVVMPWSIMDYDRTGIVSPALDHIGFKVESMEAFTAEFDRLAIENRAFFDYPVGLGPEGEARLELARKSCPLCKMHLTDADGVLLSVSD